MTKKAHAGDRVSIICKDKTYEGILMPNEETNAVILKLDSGYNIGIEKENIKKIVLIKKYSKKKSAVGKITSDRSKPFISIMHTGGTIASKVDYETGGVIARFSPKELVDLFPELKQIANIDSWLIANMFSEDMRFKHYQIIARDIVKEIRKNVKGVIITHGTDTLAYTSAALSFMLENCPIPVILVGAQRSSDRGSSDAAMNLVCAAEFIAKTDFRGVAVCMHESNDDKSCLIMPACKTRKLHTSRRDAFKIVNDRAYARIDYDTRKITQLKGYPKTEGKFVLREKMEEKVGLLKIYPSMIPEQFSCFKGYKGLIIEGTGLGHAPVSVPNEHCRMHEKNLKAIEGLIKKGCVVVMCSQCIFGRVDMHVYSNGRKLINAGVISGEDMLSETAFIKLAWLLGNYKKEEVKKLIGKNLRGEIRERSSVGGYLE